MSKVFCNQCAYYNDKEFIFYHMGYEKGHTDNCDSPKNTTINYQTGAKYMNEEKASEINLSSNCKWFKEGVPILEDNDGNARPGGRKG